MTQKKIVDGVEVDCSPEEIAEFQAFQANAKTPEELNLIALRFERNQLLSETDWTQNRDVTLSNDADWKTYRQALRDITDSATSLDDVTWPTKPS